MRVLVACEYSQTVTKAFRAKGHEAFSCDLLPTEGNPEWHIQGDAIEAAYSQPWDLMIAHPECTYLTNAGVCWLYNKDGSRNEERWENMRSGARFFKALLDAPISHKCIENPIMHKYAAEIIGSRATQFVQPWMFGHMEQKATGLHLVNLPKLLPTDNVKEEMMKLPKNKRERLHYLPPGPDRWKERSRTYQGIADAMADQWGNLTNNKSATAQEEE